MPEKYYKIALLQRMRISASHGVDLVQRSAGFRKMLIRKKEPGRRTSLRRGVPLQRRLRLKDKNTLEDRITITDPKTFTRSW
jgi:hypothetical protein